MSPSSSVMSLILVSLLYLLLDYFCTLFSIFMCWQMLGESVSEERSNTRTVVSLLNTDGTWSETNTVLPRAPVNIDQEAYFTSMEDYY